MMLKEFSRIIRGRRRISSDPLRNGEHLLAQHLLPQCRVVFDVGARTDDYLVHLNPNCDFHLFEPMAESHAELCRKTAGNSRVRVVNTALGNETAQKLLYPDTQSLHKRPRGTAAPISIQMQRLDDYCEANAVESIDFLKIDVEGCELDVMRGGRRMLQNHVDVVQFEYGGTYREVGIRLCDVLDFLGNGWSIYRIEVGGLVSVEEYSPHLENYQYANFVASRRPLSYQRV